MDTCGTTQGDERTVAMLWANTWGLNFLLFALLADTVYRGLVYHEAAWDLLALIFISGMINAVYAARHHVLVFNRKSVMVLVISAVVAAIVAAVLAITKAV